MSTPIPNLTPGVWNAVINSGAVWGPVTVQYDRDGVIIIPVSAALTFHSPEGVLLLTLNATIGGGGVMTVPALSGTDTAALTWQYATMLFRTVESGSVPVDLLAGNATVRNYAD